MIWDGDSQAVLASVPFDETGCVSEGWVRQALPSPLFVNELQAYVVGIDYLNYYAMVTGGTLGTVTSGFIQTAGGLWVQELGLGLVLSVTGSEIGIGLRVRD